MEPVEHYFLGLGLGGFHRLAYAAWGHDRSQPPVLCVHGLTRNGRDFDALAADLAWSGRAVICPDVVGRGRSGWLANPALYGYPQYLADAAALIARLDVPAVDWVGTSMGGLIGMMLAAQPNTPIRRLVLNDVGPFIPQAALQRIGSYVGQDPVFADIDGLEAYLRRVHAPFGPLTDAQWRHLATHSARRRNDGTLGLAYDPGIAAAFAGPIADVDLWMVWDQIRCPVLVVRGAESDLLTAATAERMAARPDTVLITVAGCGHAPALMAPGQIAPIRDWLAG
ncbi:alpha/beta fold hydrolase [Inquilinus limosus]|uniref:alpha/beta fold hydrolase n=1 Tax=Inquilinus limosus TaxID=171674 RepID=UPI00041F7F6D|nr:alpha/beta hydrolase [Inquilinus limosus]